MALRPMLTHKIAFTRTRRMLIIVVAEMSLIREMAIIGGLDPLMRPSIRAVVGTGRRGILTRATQLRTAMSRKAGGRWTIRTMDLNVAHHLLTGQEGNKRMTAARVGITNATKNLAPKEIVDGKATMVGKRGSVTETRTGDLITKMTVLYQRRTAPGNLGLVGMAAAGTRGTATSAAAVGKEKTKEKRIINIDNANKGIGIENLIDVGTEIDATTTII
jgi:hypothetical protein